jgi:hypothetical protein
MFDYFKDFWTSLKEDGPWHVALFIFVVIFTIFFAATTCSAGSDQAEYDEWLKQQRIEERGEERLTDWMPEGIAPLTTQEVHMNQEEQLNNLLESLIMFTAVFAAVLMVLMALIVGTLIWLGQRDPNRKLNRPVKRRVATPEEIQRARDIMDPELPPVKFEQDFWIDPVICPHCKKHTDKELVDGVCEPCFWEAEAWEQKHGDSPEYREE